MKDINKYNSLILKYFSYTGQLELNCIFANEMGLLPDTSPLLRKRSKIRILLEQGEIDKGITKINELSVELMNDELYFYLTLHKGYEMAYEVYNSDNTRNYDRWIIDGLLCGNKDDKQILDYKKDTVENDIVCDNQLVNNSNSKDEKILNILSFIRNLIGELSFKYEKNMELFLEYLIFNDIKFNIHDKRVELADRVNKLILKYYNQDINELEEIIKEIILEEHLLSQKNKFTEFKKIIMEK